VSRMRYISSKIGAVLSGRIYRHLENNYPEHEALCSSTKLHGIVFQKIVLLMVTDLRVFTLTARCLFSEYMAQAFVLCPIPVWTRQAMHCTYCVPLRRVLVTIVAVEKHCILRTILWVCVCSLRYPMSIRRIVICGLSRSTIFFHIIS